MSRRSKELPMATVLNQWMTEQALTSTRLLQVMREMDPSGRGICRRSLFNYRQTGNMDLRSLVLLVASVEKMFEKGEVKRPLALRDFDQWGFLSS
tara:strand:- start:99 stop:383 length:285 start_codon:yes stop_codon:yes gene_type:complete